MAKILTISVKLKPIDEIKILQYAAQLINSGLDIDLVLKKLVELASEASRADSCLIYLLEKERGELILRASKNPHPRIIGKIALKPGEGITGWVAKHKKPVAISRGARKDPRFKFFHNLPEDTYEAFLSVPIMHKGEVIGVINLQHRNPHRYSPNLIRLTSYIANQAAVVIANARLFEEAQRSKELLETRRLVEKAKGILMKKGNISEEEAHKFINKKSMDSSKSMKEIAQAIVLANEIGF